MFDATVIIMIMIRSSLLLLLLCSDRTGRAFFFSNSCTVRIVIRDNKAPDKHSHKRTAAFEGKLCVQIKN